jgi:hypothetical protein
MKTGEVADIQPQPAEGEPYEDLTGIHQYW